MVLNRTCIISSILQALLMSVAKHTEVRHLCTHHISDNGLTVWGTISIRGNDILLGKEALCMTSFQVR